MDSFDLFGDTEVSLRATNVKLDVIKLDYLSSESLTWQELFSGYNRIKAITFSSGIGFVGQLLKLFDDAEIIFGCEQVMSNTLQEVMAYQAKLLERIRAESSVTQQYLIDRIEGNSLRLWVSRQQLSHEKIYLLESDSGERRVVMGSANLSFNAFGGRQRENITYMDGDRAYERYLEIFEALKERSSDRITKSALVSADVTEHLDQIPIAETIRVQKAIYLEAPSEEETAEVRFILDTHQLAKKIAPSISISKSEKKAGRILVSADVIQKVKRQRIREEEKEREVRNEYPQLRVDVAQGVVFLNDQQLDLDPSREAIQQDVDLFVKYMSGYSRFHGDAEGMQAHYYEFANWFFCSPFMAVMRDTALRYDQKTLPYPVFGLVYGQSKAGKTSFLETLLKMMIGQKIKVSAPDFTRTTVDGLRRTVQGAPIIVDDLTNTRFNQHAIETIKNDDFGYAEHLLNYPAVVISANEDVKAVAPEVTRRTVICRVQAGLTNTEVMKSNIVRSVQQKIGTAFYRCYLREMLKVLPDLMEQLKDDDPESEAPDILKVSATILYNLFAEYLEEVPQYIQALSLENYFSERVTGRYTLQVIREAWQTNPKAFIVDKRTRTLQYDAGGNWDADRLMKELPETLCARRLRDSIIMDLEVAKAFFGINFKEPSFFKRLLK